ncbi:MAG: helix-turn-helix transcriptional regulator [Proteobacteria bacterium]|nr:helix-turn-helix transcriptional regulator [Pseudomonadota bacterium]
MEIWSAVDALSALAHESRLAIFRLLVPEGPDGLPAGEIGKRLGIAANALSFHLTRLRYAGLVSVRRNGQQMIYAASYDGMQRLMGFLTENCCQLDARGCSSDCPRPLPNPKKQKRSRQKVRAA